MDNQKLSARVEQLSGPDREADVEIALAVEWSHPSAGCSLRKLNEVMTVAEIATEAREHSHSILSQLPRYTASLDAAMSLVPEGMWHEIKGPRRYLNIPTASPNYWSARLEAWGAGAEGMGWGATPAIALCAAALKARGL